MRKIKIRRDRSRARRRRRIPGLNVLFARRDGAGLHDEQDDCPICRAMRAEGIPTAIFDFNGRMLGIEKPTEMPSITVRVHLDGEDPQPVDVTVPEASTYRELLAILEGFAEPALLRAPPRADGMVVSLDERVTAGGVIRLEPAATG